MYCFPSILESCFVTAYVINTFYSHTNTHISHEMPTDPNDPLAKQNMLDRYYGVNDPVAEKIMRRAASTLAI